MLLGGPKCFSEYECVPAVKPIPCHEKLKFVIYKVGVVEFIYGRYLKNHQAALKLLFTWKAFSKVVNFILLLPFIVNQTT